MQLADLKKELPYQWRVQSFSKNVLKASCVAYINARDVMNRLDEVCGPENWQDDYRLVGTQLYAGIGVKTEDGWVWKYDTGSESNIEKEKGQASDSFKRAAVKWGIGRFLYDLPVVYVDCDATRKFVVSNGKRVFDLTKHISSLQKRSKP